MDRTFVIDVSEVDALAVRTAGAQAVIDREIEAFLTDAAITVQSRATRLVPVDTGTLKNSIAYEPVERVGVAERRVTVGSQIEYAPYVHEGTGIYGPLRRPIVPVTASVLSWVGRDGRRVFARSVRGMRPRRFLADAVTQSAADLQRLAAAAGVRIVRQVMG